MMPQRFIPAAAKRAAGFTLIEVLIALLVLSIGLLGLASLQANALQFNREAYLRSQATNLAYALADRMRANRDAAIGGQYAALAAYASPAPGCAAPAAAGTVAERDISYWLSTLACTLPGGNGRATVDAANVVTIDVQWDERGTQTFQMVTGL